MVLCTESRKGCRMGQPRYETIKGNGELVQALTSLTVEEIAELAGPFEVAFRAHMAEWTLEGKRRQNRSYVTYANTPLPTAEDRLLFILSYLKENPTQTYHGRLYGMSQGKANHWIHTLFPVLRMALRALGDAPGRDFAAVLARLEAVTEQSGDSSSADEPVPPLLPTTPPSGPSRAPSLPLNRSATSVARNASTRSRTCSS
jgi:hypothetical protein